jgi:hypothetical protein
MSSVFSSSNHIFVASTSQPYVNMDYSQNGVINGDVRWDRHNGMQVWDGYSWNALPKYEMFMSPEAEYAITWVIQKMNEEKELQSMMDEYPVLKDAKQNFDAMVALLKDYSNKETA